MQYILPGHIDRSANTHLSEGIRAGDLVFVSGQLAVDEGFNLLAKGDVAGQTRAIFDSIRRIVAEGGGALQDVVWLQFFVLDLKDRGTLASVTREYFGAHRPVSTMIQVNKLAITGALLEINAIAALGEKRPIRAGAAGQAPHAHRSEGIRAGDLVFVSGQAATDDGMKIAGRGDIAAQARRVFANMDDVLKEAGGSLGDVGWMHLFLTTIGDRTKFTPVRYEMFGEHRPAATLVEIGGFAMDGMLLEVNAIASSSKDRQYIEPGHLDQLINTHLSEGIRAGNVIFVSGQTPLDEQLRFVGAGDIIAQTRQIFANMTRILSKAGGTLRDIVWLQLFLTDIGQRTRITPLRRELFGEHRPAATLVEISKLAIPEMLIEIDALAVLER